MRDHIVPKLPKWPFFLGDALLIGLAGYICWQAKLPLAHFELACIVLCALGGALIGIQPFLSEHRAIVKVAQAENLSAAVHQIKNLEQVATQIASATNHWQTAQDAADKTTRAAKEISETMTNELKSFTDFMQRSNDGEKAALRLEVEKSRRSEGEWLQIIVRLLDHTFALHAGAVRSGQPNVIRQIDAFQNACRDTTRRVGLLAFIPAPGEKFDAARHQLADSDAKPAEGALIGETLGVGYTFQGQLIRQAIVRLQEAPATTPAPADDAQVPLPLEPAKTE
ncbi:MAG: nucleotide exchange factor GrpE [Verrucomicrobiota bacterium]